ncbi:MAG: hypothetical protein HRU20_13000 [Pseudomonadales bacterium]|nr:hypothetical protein [Pseudomonadales bacterium]
MKKITNYWLVSVLLLLSGNILAASGEEIVEGFTDFLVERAEANALAVFERKLKNNANFQCYFPKTYQSIEKISLKELFDYKGYWQQGIDKDLEAFATRLFLQKLETQLHISENNIQFISTYIELMQLLAYRKNGVGYPLNVSPYPAIADVNPVIYGFYDSLVDVTTRFDQMKRFSEFCHAPVVSIDDVKRLYTDFNKINNDIKKWMNHVNKYRSALVLSEDGQAKACALFDVSGDACDAVKKDPWSEIEKRIPLADLTTLIEKINSFQSDIQAIESVFYQIDASLLSMLRVQAPLLMVGNFDQTDQSSLLQLLDEISNDAAKREENVVQAMSLIKSKSLMSDTDVEGYYNRLKSLQDYSADKTRKATAVLKIVDSWQVLSDRDLRNLSNNILFFTKISEADSKDNVTAILKAYTLPDVSFSAKRGNSSSVFLSSYFAISASVYVDDQGSDLDTVSGAGLYLPVGLEYNWGLNGNGAISVMFSPLDMAYPVNLKLDGVEQSIEFDSIFAPSLSLAYGLENYPLNIGVSFQRGQTLEDVNETEERVLLFFGFDMPLFRLY